jgi:hypothetical protein
MVAGEAKRPRIYIKDAFKTVYWRFAIFFMGGALFVGIVLSSSDPTLVGIVTGECLSLRYRHGKHGHHRSTARRQRTAGHLHLQRRQHLYLLRYPLPVRPRHRRQSAQSSALLHQGWCATRLLRHCHGIPLPLILAGQQRIQRCPGLAHQFGHCWRCDQLPGHERHLHLLLPCLQSAGVGQEYPAVQGLVPAVLCKLLAVLIGLLGQLLILSRAGIPRRRVDDHDRLLLRLHELRALLRQRLLYLLHSLARW